MSRPNNGLIKTREFYTLLEFLRDPECRGVEVLGPAAIGKTSLLRLAREELIKNGRDAFDISLRLWPEEDLAKIIVLTVRDVLTSRLGTKRPDIGGSRSRSGIGEAVDILTSAQRMVKDPVLLIDGLDEAAEPYVVASQVDELSRQLSDWRIVVSSRSDGSTRLRRAPGFRTLELRGINPNEAAQLVLSIAPDMSAETVAGLVSISEGHPLFLHIAAEAWDRAPGFIEDLPHSLAEILALSIGRLITTLPNPGTAQALLRRLAFSDTPLSTATLAADVGVSIEEVSRLVSEMGFVAIVDDKGGVALIHRAVRDLIVGNQLTVRSFSLSELDFGAEEAERDDQLDVTYVGRPGVAEILTRDRTIVLGDRGSGKSAIFRRICSGAEGTLLGHTPAVHPIADASSILQRISVEGSAPSTAEEYRAAWLLIVALTLACALPGDAPKELINEASALRAAFGFTGPRQPILSRVIRFFGRGIAGTSLTFGVGPVNLTAKAPGARSGSERHGSYIDIEAFLARFDQFLVDHDRSAIVPIDRIDELFKYDRQRQERLIQGLFQAENRVARFHRTGLVLFLRTDLFELYDIQEKNKLVSRTLLLQWSDSDWLRVLVNRVFANAPVRQLARAAGVIGESDVKDVGATLGAIFPDDIEGQPVDRWLIDSVKKGNGSVSPRLVVLLLVLARDLTTHRDNSVSRFPLFAGQTIRDAMTRLSQLSYAEVVDDFKVAPGFVLNARAGKIHEFTQPQVEQLFDLGDGPIAVQVQLLERLGFLERIVVDEGEGEKRFSFRIPKLYTRSWDGT